ncbi:PipA/GogA/GtgA family type III secretion system effector, partial [Pseudomonas congelans]|uniref:PipA/GogA/GtgA family type III secretion system effector n=1 Tax=Pseudomonas congelans TaxID=200452 RepID=UPI001F38752F
MFPNPAVITPKVPVQAAVNRADLHSIDQRLAMTHRDMAAQAMNPSALRKAHDNIALDDSPRLPLSQLNQYLLKAECLSIKGKSSGYIAALEFLDRSLKLAYDKSPSFRRLFNHAWVERLNNAQSRYAISILGNEQLGSGGLELPDVLKRGPKPKYVSAIGLTTLSNERAVLEATVKALTQLSDHEPGHPRGANPEYVNIILKEMGIRDSAQTEHNFEQAKPKPLQHSPGSLALHQITKRFGNNINVPTLGEGFKDKAKIHFTNVAQENLVLINQRGSPKNTYLAKVAYEEKRAASLLPDLLIRLFQSVQGSENPMEILEKLSFQTAKQRMFSYNIEKSRNP